MKLQNQISSVSYKSEGFIKSYQELIRTVVIPYQYDILNDKIPDAEKSHAIQNFINAGKSLRGDTDHDGFYGMVFQDSDVAKWLEAAAYSLSVYPDKELEKKVDDLIEIIASAQDTDGYLNTYFTIKDRDKRWTNLLEGHELYCAGHMIEAAVAYYEATGKTVLLDVMKKNADHIYKYFVKEKHPGYPGHPEIELSLIKLYRVTGEKKYLELARHFIDVRGVDAHFYEKEAEKRDWQVWGNDPKNGAYQQSAMPVRALKDAEGHSVRAVYLYTAMADLASEIEDKALSDACKALFDSIVRKRMYVTGAIGSTVIGEAFSVDYNLPNDTVYGETCASIGLMFFVSRMLETDVKGIYGDILEKAFYNTVLAGMQLDGKRFFYVNPLEVIPGISGEAQTHRHSLPKRPKWYACACCPPNVARTISSIAKYGYGENDTTAFCHLFMAGTINFKNGLCIKCTTEYPYDFTVNYRVEAGTGNLAIRIPGWSDTFTVSVNGRKESGELRDGYYYLEGLCEGDQVQLLLDDKVKRVYCSTNVASNTGACALQRGPLVYCAEGIDNEEDVLGLFLKEDGEVMTIACTEEKLGNITMLSADGYRVSKTYELYTMNKPQKESVKIKAVPYYTWGNRGINQMRVWLPERP